jgi:beta-ribofuranosylaminobenzene 5'-phosphate synthase
MFRVWTPSRLHFGLLTLAGDQDAWPDRRGELVLPARRFGGVGLMVEQPGVQVAVSAAGAWSAEGSLAKRALAFALHFAESVRRERPDADLPPMRMVVEQAPAEHIGLGVGTQLGLAVAQSLAATWNLSFDAPELARLAGRGLRSALGVHGFAQGGFLVESGKRAGQEGLAPLAARASFPPEWRLVLATPREAPGLHGPREHAAFARLTVLPDRAARTDALCRLALLGMLPALAEADLAAFGECLFDFNARVGEAFAAVQGGVYSGPRVAECVEFLRGEGIRGVGQSSWGPTVFAVVGDEERAEQVRQKLASRFGLGPTEAWTTVACNSGSLALIGPAG